ncbi:MAG TPA: outer membrane beta-barrel protein [Bacteroidia bacterium]|nr:outer membrane beta-barrel protein [Bacteroidia bacterium]
MKQIKNQFNFIRMASVIVFLFAFSIAQAQNNLNITFRPGANFPTKDLGETKLSNGGGFEGTVSYRFMPHLGAYAGWGWNAFSETKSIADSKNEFEETGYTFGLQFIHPFSPESKLDFMIGGGGIYNHIETENKEGDIIHDTGHGLGWQAEAGLSIPVGHHNRWHLIPAVRYRALSRDIAIEGINTTVDLNYFSAGMGVSWTVWSAEK